MFKKSKLKKIIVAVLAVTMVIGNMSIASAASGSSDLGNYNAYYDAYCTATSGDATTYVYIDNNVTDYYASVSMDLYVVKIGIWNNTTNVDTLERESFKYDSDSQTSTDNNSGQVIADAYVYCGSSYHGWRVSSRHSAEVRYNSRTYPGSQTLTAYCN